MAVELNEGLALLDFPQPVEIPPPKDSAEAKSVKRGVYKIVGLPGLPLTLLAFYNICLPKYQMSRRKWVSLRHTTQEIPD